MEGFHLFQEKIKGEVNKTAGGGDLQILFLQTDAVKYDAINRWVVPDCESFYEFEEELDSHIQFKLDYSASKNKSQLYLEDFRDVLYNYNNDLEAQDRKTVIMFYD